MRKFIYLFVVALSVLSFSGCSTDASTINDAQIVWRLSHEESVGSIQDQYAHKFKELVEERSNNKIRVEVFSLGQLGDGVGGVELIRYGVVNFSINNPATVATIVPENQLMSLHYTFSSDTQLNREVLNDGEAIKELNKLYEEKDIIPLHWFQEGFQVVTSNHPINTPEDMEGFKIRVMASPLLVAAYQAYGANPTPVPYMEVYSNLQLNMIDGQVNPVFAIEEMKFYEVQEYLNFLNNETFIGTFCANPTFWNTMSEEERKMIDEIVVELDEYIFKRHLEVAEERLEKIKEEKPLIGIVEYTEEQRQAFEEKSIAGREYYYRAVGEETAEKLLGLLENDFDKFEVN
jgi:tripartite ATP-independent transporter DctP family solute receptor